MIAALKHKGDDSTAIDIQERQGLLWRISEPRGLLRQNYYIRDRPLFSDCTISGTGPHFFLLGKAILPVSEFGARSFN